jgi:hypothetical protein
MGEIDLGLNLYEFNKQGMAQEKPLDVIDFNRQIINMVEDVAARSKYWMLLCRERNDYTVFIILTKEGTVSEILETLLNRGLILAIDKQKDGNYEIWIRDRDTNENFVYYFFNYEFGIVKA